jgi:hypothetical protein
MDFIARAFEKVALQEELMDFSEPLNAARRITKDYFLSEILSPQEFEFEHEKAIQKAKTLLSSSYAEAFERSFWQLSYAHSCFKHSVAIQSLLPKGLQVFGPDWDRILKMPESYRSFYPDRQEFYSICAGTKVYFCHHKDQLMEAINERVYVASAVGGFPISNHQEDFDRYFEEGEIVTYRSLPEAHELIDYYLTHDEEREKLALKARAKVARYYTSKPWAEALVDIIRNKWGLCS